MFFEGVGFVGYGADTALSVIGVTLDHFALSNDRYVASFGSFERERKTRSATTDNQEICFHSGFVELNVAQI
jgi:hypothetical protein